MLLAPKSGIIYGPVQSRRLGLSLGINLLPLREKKCTFDCVYCQYGWTLRPPSESDGFPAVDEVLAAVEQALRDGRGSPAFLTFSGNGEPATHPQFLPIVEGVRALRDRLLPAAKLAILSNSTCLNRPQVGSALALLDRRIMKLDAGTEEVFQRYCRPTVPIGLDVIVAALTSLGDVTLQTLFAGGPGGNADAAHVSAWIEKVVAIAPVDVQIYTLDRSWPSRAIVPLDAGRLRAIAEALRQAGCPVTVASR